MKDKYHQEKKLSEVANFELEIVRFDTVLDDIQNYFPQDTHICNFVAYARDSIFRLQEALHGPDSTDFISALGRPWWVDQFIEEENKGKEVA